MSAKLRTQLNIVRIVMIVSVVASLLAGAVPMVKAGSGDCHIDSFTLAPSGTSFASGTHILVKMSGDCNGGVRASRLYIGDHSFSENSLHEIQETLKTEEYKPGNYSVCGLITGGQDATWENATSMCVSITIVGSGNSDLGPQNPTSIPASTLAPSDSQDQSTGNSDSGASNSGASGCSSTYHVGQIAQVVHGSYLNTEMRSGSMTIVQMPEGYHIKLLEGPFCNGSDVWWKAQERLYDDMVGYITERDFYPSTDDIGAPPSSSGNNSGCPQSNLSVGMYADINMDVSGLARIIIRPNPYDLQSVQEVLAGPGTMLITDGPVCTEGTLMWKIRTEGYVVEGWVNEAAPRGLGIVPSNSGGTSNTSCGVAVPSKMYVGSHGRVTFTDGKATGLRDSPNGTVLLKMPEGTEFDVIGGPVCKGNLLWWQVKLSDGMIGWAPEGQAPSDYWIEPYGAPLISPTVDPNFIASTDGIDSASDAVYDSPGMCSGLVDSAQESGPFTVYAADGNIFPYSNQCVYYAYELLGTNEQLNMNCWLDDKLQDGDRVATASYPPGRFPYLWPGYVDKYGKDCGGVYQDKIVDSSPGAVQLVIWERKCNGANAETGHVAVVRSVNGTKIYVDERNYDGYGSTRTNHEYDIADCMTFIHPPHPVSSQTDDSSSTPPEPPPTPPVGNPVQNFVCGIFNWLWFCPGK